MKQEKDIRKENLLIIIGISDEGSIAGVAKKTGIARSTLNGNINQDKEMSSRNARLIEQAYDKPFGWMDQPHDTEFMTYDADVLLYVTKFIWEHEQAEKHFNDLSVSGKTDLLDTLYVMFSDPAARNLSYTTLLRTIGVKNERNVAGKNTGNDGKTKNNI